MGCSSWILRLSTFRPRASRIASAISVVVTDPYRRPSGPAWAGMVRTVLVRVSAWSLARSAAWAAARSAASWARRAASIEAGVAGWASRRGVREVRRKPLETSTTVPRSPRLSTSLSRMAVGMPVLALVRAALRALGRAAAQRGRLVGGVREQRELAGALDGRAIWLWWRRQAPVM